MMDKFKDSKLEDLSLGIEKTLTKESYEVASQYQLMWWKFKKHHLAMIAGPVLIFLYLLAIFCEFLAPTLPTRRFVDHKNMRPVTIHFVDEDGVFSLRPFIYNMKMGIDPETFRREYVEVTSEKYPLKLFFTGDPYKMWGLFETNIHLIGIEPPPEVDYQFLFMGTDELGRDLFSRILYGSRISLSFGLVSIFFTFILGMLLGGLSGYFGGIIDNIIQRLIDILLCIPTIPLWMSLAAALPRTWDPLRIYLGMVLIMSMIGWTGLARVVRGKILSLREEDFVMAARLSGSTQFRIITKHLIPSFISYIIVSMTLSIPASILGETALSFLGLGLQPPVVSWGVLLRGAQNLQTLAHHPWLLWPAAFVIITVLMFNFLGDGLRDAADPYK
jgi:peptide/nickel transport system permease protein